MPAQELPRDCWYAVAGADEVGRDLLPRRVAGRSVVLLRTEAGAVVALDDRCAHRPYPLSLGTVVHDDVHCGLCGFVYDTGGRCVRVPTQQRVPIGASVAALPVREQHGTVWVWAGEPGLAARHRVPDLPWLEDEGWASVGGAQDVAAGFLLLHESFADVTKVRVLAPDLAPHALAGVQPPLDVVVTETTVSLARDFPPAPLPAWQAAMVGRDPDAALPHRQEGHFLSPAAWVDYWDVLPTDGTPPARLRFTQLVTPVDAGRSRLLWRVSRDFALDDDASTSMAALFRDYYARSLAAVETLQEVLHRDGPGTELHVASDVAALKIRQIVLGRAGTR
jgi:vanillate O-demethylase monooxygenase subunit